MISVIIADDHAVVRTGLQLIFTGEPDIDIKGEARNGEELMTLLLAGTFDAAVIDINMPGKDSLDLINDIRKHFPKLPIVIFTMNTDEQLSTRLLKNGVMACINKEENPEELVKAVRQAANNERYLTLKQQKEFAAQFVSGNQAQVLHDKLTDKEYRVMLLLAEGKSKTEISEKLNISKNTISNHRNSILKKLELKNNAELTRYNIQHQLIS